MEKTANNRNSLRMVPENNRGGVYLNGRAVRVQLVNMSLTGCGFRIPKKRRVEIGDQIRVATSQGQFDSIVRRIADDQNDSTVKIIGVEFQKEIRQKANRKGSFLASITGDTRHQVGGGFGSASSVLMVVAWLAIGLFAAACLVGFDKFPVLKNFVN